MGIPDIKIVEQLGEEPEIFDMVEMGAGWEELPFEHAHQLSVGMLERLHRRAQAINKACLGRMNVSRGILLQLRCSLEALARSFAADLEAFVWSESDLSEVFTDITNDGAVDCWKRRALVTCAGVRSKPLRAEVAIDLAGQMRFWDVPLDTSSQEFAEALQEIIDTTP